MIFNLFLKITLFYIKFKEIYHKFDYSITLDFYIWIQNNSNR